MTTVAPERNTDVDEPPAVFADSDALLWATSNPGDLDRPLGNPPFELLKTTCTGLITRRHAAVAVAIGHADDASNVHEIRGTLRLLQWVPEKLWVRLVVVGFVP